MPTWSGLLSALLRGESLDGADARWAMGQVMRGDATPAQVAGMAVALRAKGESAQEVGGFVEAMLDAAAPLAVEGPAVDTCGTGGDRAHTVNISTMAAVVVAGAGDQVVKHGNRAASSACGSADLLEELGVVVDLPPDGVGACVADAGIGFCFAPVFHPGMRHAAAARRELGIATVFNFLGPLTNPARPDAQAVGCSDPRLAGVMAGVLAARGSTALVFRGDDGLDELTPTTTSRVWVVAGGRVEETVLDPGVLGIERCASEDLRGGDAARNAAVTRALLAGEPGAVRDAVTLNAAAALAARAGLDGASDLRDALQAGLVRARESIDSGSAAAALERWVTVSRRLAAR